jgi:hypothetical protein
MKFRALVLLSLCVVVTTIPLAAQTCSSTSYTNTLICTLPQLFGPQGLTLPNPTHNAHFAGSSKTLLALPVNQGTGQALAILPLGSSGSGTTFTLDAQGHPVPTEDSLGPILVGRANVIGKKAINLGVAYQHFNFTHLDGIRLSSFPAVLTHEGWSTSLGNGTITEPVYKQDYVTTSNQVHLDLNQTVIYAVFGITNHMDASIELPIQSAHLRVFSTAHIVRTQPCEGTPNANPALGGNCYPAVPAVPNDPNNDSECGEFHYFQGYSDTMSGEQKDCTLIFNSVDATFPNPGISFQMANAENGPVVIPPRPVSSPIQDATGIGDITLRGKYQVIHREKLVGAVGLELRFPSGDAQNFLGTGAYGVTPFGALTYNSRLSPHVRFGYEWNSNSVLAGDPTVLPKSQDPTATTSPSASLPPAWLYSGGADFRATKRLTVVADLIGEYVLDVNRLTLGSYPMLQTTDGKTDPSTKTKVPVQSILVNSRTSVYNSANVPRTSSYSSDSIAVGGKVRLFKELVLIGNATIRVDDGGLRADVVPLVGLSYAF